MESTHKSRFFRRRCRLSLRGLFAAITIACFVLLLVAVRIKEQQRILRLAKDLSESGVAWQYESNGSLPVVAELQGAALNEEIWNRIGQVSSLRSITTRFDRCDRTNDDWLSGLHALRKLESLRVSSSHISGTGLRHLKECQNLTEIHLADCPVTDEGCRAIRNNCKHLKEIYLSKTRLTDAGIKMLLQIQTLQQLRVDGDFELLSHESFNNSSALQDLTIEGSIGTVEIADLDLISRASIGANSDLGARKISLSNLPSLTDVDFFANKEFYASHLPMVRKIFVSGANHVTLDEFVKLDLLVFELCDFKQCDSHFTYSGGPIKRVEIRGGGGAEVILRGLAISDQVEQLDLSGVDLTPGVVTALLTLKSLKSLEFYGELPFEFDAEVLSESRITSISLIHQNDKTLQRWFEYCANMPKLVSLALHSCETQGEDIERLKKRHGNVTVTVTD